MTSASPERKTFFDSASGYHWAFWYSGSDVSYGYSSDSTNFSPSDSPLSINTPLFTLSTKNGIVLIAYQDGFDIMVRRGTISCTSITWESAVTALDGSSVNDAFSKPAMTVGADDGLYIAALQFSATGGGYTPRAARSINLYSSELSWMDTSVVGAATVSPTNLALVPQGNYAMALTTGIDGAVAGYEFNGSSWVLRNGSITDWVRMVVPNSGAASITKVNAIAMVGSKLYKIDLASGKGTEAATIQGVSGTVRDIAILPKM